jgi:hypothetical protein
MEDRTMTNAAPDLGADGIAARARLTTDAIYRGKIVARQVAQDALDHYALAGQITVRQYEAGMRLRAANAGSWFRPKVTSAALYASDPGLDDGEETQTEEERYEAMQRNFETVEAARRIVGDLWMPVRGVCCYASWATSYPGGIPALRVGLERLADGWGVGR